MYKGIHEIGQKIKQYVYIRRKFGATRVAWLLLHA